MMKLLSRKPLLRRLSKKYKHFIDARTTPPQKTGKIFMCCWSSISVFSIYFYGIKSELDKFEILEVITELSEESMLRRASGFKTEDLGRRVVKTP
jgi:hypothetical protein